MIKIENPELIYVKGKNVDYLQFKRLLKYKVKHAYTLRCDNLDFSKYGEVSKESYELLCEELNLDFDNLCIPIQTHTDVVKCVGENKEEIDLNDVDGLITKEKEKILVSRNADCILFLLYDPKNKVIANVHSGWKGTFKKIVEKAVVKMRDYYGCNPENIVCCICPSIRKCHFEVDEDIKELCEDIFSFTGKTEAFIEKGNIVEGKQKYNIDTVLINKILLNDLGIKDKNIIDSNLCSVCNKDILYSYRAEGKASKRNVAIISL